jgi:hypothetical protein
MQFLAELFRSGGSAEVPPDRKERGPQDDKTY